MDGGGQDERGDPMGNRAVITTERNFETNSGLGVYLHWNGGRDSVQGFLEYCRLRSFRTPENDDYGWARLCQVIGNFLGADGLSVGIDEIRRLDKDNGDNGTYLIEGWRIVGRRFYEGQEQERFTLQRALHAIDEAQPEDQQLGAGMIDSLLYNDRTIADVAWSYQREVARRKDEGISVDGFRIGRFYSDNRSDTKRFAKVIDKTPTDIIFVIDGQAQKCPVFHWKDGSESTILIDGDGRERNLDSSEEVVA